jgi:hypothetical protein
LSSAIASTLLKVDVPLPPFAQTSGPEALFEDYSKL